MGKLHKTWSAEVKEIMQAPLQQATQSTSQFKQAMQVPYTHSHHPVASMQAQYTHAQHVAASMQAQYANSVLQVNIQPSYLGVPRLPSIEEIISRKMPDLSFSAMYHRLSESDIASWPQSIAISTLSKALGKLLSK